MQQITKKEIRELSQSDIEYFAKWAKRKEERSRTFLSPVLIIAYRYRPLRPMIKKLTIKLEGGVFFTKTLRDIFEHFYDIKIGMYSYGGVFNARIFYPAKVTIGNYCTIASILSVYRRNHPIQRVSTHPLFYNNIYSALKNDCLDIPSNNPLYIGHDVWIGRSSIILPGCNTIGDGAIIGAGSVVSKDVEPYTIVVGNPARILRRRYPKNIEEKIIESKWWLQPLSSLAEKLPCFINDPGIDLFNRFNF